MFRWIMIAFGLGLVPCLILVCWPRWTVGGDFVIGWPCGFYKKLYDVHYPWWRLHILLLDLLIVVGGWAAILAAISFGINYWMRPDLTRSGEDSERLSAE